ncbi:MAG TPA: serine acetyltransferase [Candidatus Enterocola sp.]|jgi:serine O-acetyltransferase|nr:serine acetyltransferase [Candidatus Enterocola sp.]HPG55288.1 serine acetyltransferase [Candidatus Enterocola sp.]
MTTKEYTSKIKSAVDRLTSQEFDGRLMHQNHDGEPNPSELSLRCFIDLARTILFPGFFGNTSVSSTTLPYHIGVNVEKLFRVLWEQLFAGMCFECTEEERLLEVKKKNAMNIAAEFVESLPDIKLMLRTDVEAIYKGDPAAKNFGEIILSYPGLKAIVNYRIAHKLLDLGASIIIPRIITEMAHSETGIDIHPGATIGNYFAIDHGTGVVIGETCILGDNVKIYQGVTLGAKSFPTDENGTLIKGIARHPILKNNVVVYAGATILGRITIGENAIIGGNTWVTDDVADNTSVYSNVKR